MILKRMKGEPSSLSTALSRISHSAALTTSIPPAAYEDAKRRLVMGMNTSTQMTMQMPAASPVRPSPPATLPAPRPVAPKPINSSAGMSAIRKVTAGLTNASKPSPIKTVVAKVLSSESKIKKTKPVTGPRGPQVKRKRTKPQPDEDGDNDASSTSSLSSLEPSVAPPPESTTPLTPTPLTMTKSGRQVLKPDAYDPAAMDAASRRPRAPAHHYGKRTAEQALCLKCSRMHSPATNQIVFCDGCDECWHQLCHDPWIADEIVQDRGKVWYCGTCVAKKERHATSKRQKIEQQQHHHHPHQHHHHQGRGGNKGEKGQEKGSWAGKPTQQKRAYLSTLPQQELVGLLMACLETHPDLPLFPVEQQQHPHQPYQVGGTRSIFAGTTTEGLFPRADAHPTGQINFVRKIAGAGKGTKGGGSQKEGASSQEGGGAGGGGKEDEEDDDPLAALWPRSGRGLYTRLPPDTEDGARLVDEGDFEAFSSIVYDERGRKVEENGMKV